jgi:predicted nucleic acid-binding protein
MAIPTMNLEDPHVLARIFHTARKLGVTFYDASYLIAALVSRAVLVTADRKLLGRLEGQKDSVLLRDWKSPVRKTSRKSVRGQGASFLRR